MRTRKIPFRIGTIVLLSVITVALLFAYSKEPNQQRNGFNRIYLETPRLFASASYKERIYEINRIGKNALLFRCSTPGNFLLSDSNLSELHPVSYPVIDFNEVGKRYQIDANFNTVYLFVYNKRKIICIDPVTSDSFFSVNLNTYFSRGIAVGPYTVVTRGVDSQKNQLFYKVSLPDGKTLPENNVSPKLRDAGMATDGQLSYDPTTGLLAYVFYYGNGFLCIDTNLNLVYKGNCIDTTRSYHTMVAGTNSYTHLKPPDFISKNSCVDKGILYIESGLKADNESMRAFGGHTVIDSYRLTSGDYIGSFYLPKYKRAKATKFRVFDSKIITIYRSEIFMYHLPADLPSYVSRSTL